MPKRMVVAVAFLPPTNANSLSTSMGFQAIDREADNRMMLDQSYMKDQMMNIAMDFDDDEEEDVFEF